MIDKLYLVNEDGVVVKEIDDNTMIVNRNSVRALGSTEKVPLPFIKMAMPTFMEVIEVSPLFLKLIPYVMAVSNELKYPNGYPINKENFAKKLGISEDYVRKELAKLCRRDIIRKIRTEDDKDLYLMNPWVCHIGKRISKMACDEFRNSEWHTIADNELKKVVKKYE